MPEVRFRLAQAPSASERQQLGNLLVAADPKNISVPEVEARKPVGAALSDPVTIALISAGSQVLVVAIRVFGAYLAAKQKSKQQNEQKDQQTVGRHIWVRGTRDSKILEVSEDGLDEKQIEQAIDEVGDVTEVAEQQ